MVTVCHIALIITNFNFLAPEQIKTRHAGPVILQNCLNSATLTSFQPGMSG